ncbi:MAG: hypothetical protein LQ342_007345 [Letrouitia transgressa]|nr:MAG: hypothetical protein LQ342_007345 [Letrouitia transgressa]
MPPQRTLTASSQYPPPDAPDPAYSSTPYTMPNSYPSISEKNDTSSGKKRRSVMAKGKVRIRKGKYAQLAADCTCNADIRESRQVAAQREGERVFYGNSQENAKMHRYIQDMGSTITRLETQIQRQSEFHRAEVQSLHAMIQRLEAQLQGCHETIERHERLLSTSQNAGERDGPRNNGLQRLATAAAEDDG